MKNSERTKRKLLDAATTEFAERGIAGARVDRIAALAGSNKALIYSYFGNKDELFDAVFDHLVVRIVNEISVDPHNIADYAGSLFDSYQKHPEILRLGFWDLLERSGKGMSLPHVVEVSQKNLSAIEEALSARYAHIDYSAQELMSLMSMLPIIWGLQLQNLSPPSAKELARQRFVVVSAVKKLLGESTTATEP